MTQYVAAIDQGTTSTRCMIFDHSGQVVAVDQLEHQQIFPKAGWVEHDASEIWTNTRQVCGGALARADLDATSIAAVGITNQRETTVIWDKSTGEPIHNAIVWQDTRTQAICEELGALGGGAERYRAKTGLPLATYFAGPKARWILDNVDGARERAERGELAFGTMDTWVLWNATGGIEGGLHVTDPTNASRTLLMNIDTLEWDPQLCGESHANATERRGPPVGSVQDGSKDRTVSTVSNAKRSPPASSTSTWGAVSASGGASRPRRR
jgi:glycerol kinase